MKQEKTKREVLFGCDSCLKQTKFIQEEMKVNPFPYSDGWIFVYNIQMKVLGEVVAIKNKHFCCFRCLNKYISERIKSIKLRKKKK